MQMNDIHSYRFRLKTVDRVYRFAVDTAGALLYYRLNCDLRTCRPCGLLLTVGLIITECTNLWNVYKKYFAVHSDSFESVQAKCYWFYQRNPFCNLLQSMLFHLCIVLALYCRPGFIFIMIVRSHYSESVDHYKLLWLLYFFFFPKQLSPSSLNRHSWNFSMWSGIQSLWMTIGNSYAIYWMVALSDFLLYITLHFIKFWGLFPVFGMPEVTDDKLSPRMHG